MAFIYKITNSLNGKCYVGKTLGSIEERWKQHISSINREEYKKRPLYRALNKYGIANFSIESLEECAESEADSKEIYWISKLNTYSKGYNATLGGDGRAFIDKDLIIDLWKKGKTISEIKDITTNDLVTIKTVLNKNGITKQERINRGRLSYIAKPVLMFSKDGTFLKEFASTCEANRFLNIKGRGHISAVCSGKRNSCYGYVWKWK